MKYELFFLSKIIIVIRLKSHIILQDPKIKPVIEISQIQS